MADAIQRGSDEPFQQWLEQAYDPTSGFVYRSEYRGLSPVKMAALSNFYTRYGCSASLRNQFGISTLTITDATGQILIDKWEVGVEDEQPSIFENLKFLELVNLGADPSAIVTILRNALLNNDPANSKWATISVKSDFTAAVVGLSPTQITSLKSYFDDYNLGVTSFTRGKYSLRHTTNAPANPNISTNPGFNGFFNIADENVERIYTISQLLSETQNGAYWVLPLPTYLAYKISNYFVPTARPNYVWGALKKRSNAVLCARNRVEISTEYLIDQVSTNLYTPL